jgi:hypothetical protein
MLMKLFDTISPFPGKSKTSRARLPFRSPADIPGRKIRRVEYRRRIQAEERPPFAERLGKEGTAEKPSFNETGKCIGPEVRVRPGNNRLSGSPIFRAGIGLSVRTTTNTRDN